MAISGISGAPNPGVPTPSRRAEREKDFQDLAKALQNNDLAGAKQAFSALQALRQGGPSGGAAPSATNAGTANPIASDLDALAQALGANGGGDAAASGDLQAARDAFSKLFSDLQGLRGSHRHSHHRNPAQAAGLDAPAPAADTSATGDESGTRLDVTA